MKEEFEKLVAAGKINRNHVESLVRLAQCGYCTHRHFGFGKITTIDTVFSRFTIDFVSRPGHSMDLSFAADSLKPIPKDHILVLKSQDLAALQKLAATNHRELVKLALHSFGGKATIDQIQQVLVPDVITEDWKKWWDAARQELKKDGHFQLPGRKNEPIIYQVQEVSLQDRLLQEFREAKGLKARLLQAAELQKSLADLDDSKTAVEELVSLLNTDITSHQRTMPALALEAIFTRDDLRKALELPNPPGEITASDIWKHNLSYGAVIDLIPTAKHKPALQSFLEANPDNWVESVLAGINSTSSKLCNETALLLIQNGKLEQLKAALERLISQHQATSELLLWLAKERSDAFADILGPEVFRAMLSAIERDQFNEKKSNRLKDYVLNDQQLLVELIETADIDVIKDLTRALQLSPSFDDMDKRSLLARIVKHFPAIQSLIAGDQHARHDVSLIVSWASLERRKDEYNDLVHKKIPGNSKEIAIARSFGDLRENHEYKAAKEMQKILMRRKAELENLLSRARGTDFANPKTDTVNVGVQVRVFDLDAQHEEQYAILGAWDFDAEKSIISYLSPMAQAMLNHKVGDVVESETEGHRKRIRIDAIEAYQASLPVGKPEPPQPAEVPEVPPTTEPPPPAQA